VDVLVAVYSCKAPPVHSTPALLDATRRDALQGLGRVLEVARSGGRDAVNSVVSKVVVHLLR